MLQEYVADPAERAGYGGLGAAAAAIPSAAGDLLIPQETGDLWASGIPVKPGKVLDMGKKLAAKKAQSVADDVVSISEREYKPLRGLIDEYKDDIGEYDKWSKDEFLDVLSDFGSKIKYNLDAAKRWEKSAPLAAEDAREAATVLDQEAKKVLEAYIKRFGPLK